MISKALSGAALYPVILSILQRGDSYGYEIIRRVRDLSDGEVEWVAGSLYPVLRRMTSEGLIADSWVEVEGERRRRYYRITPAGQRALEREKRQWLAVNLLLARLWGLQPDPALS